MSKNYDLIATVDIDIASPIVDDSSFDNLLIMGPGPKAGGNYPDVGAYSSIVEVSDAGFVVSGDDADPVGVAARIAFAQSPSPTTIYIAVQKPSDGAIAAAELIAVVDDALIKNVGTSPDIVGCSANYNATARKATVILKGPFAEASGHGLFEALAILVADGYAVSIDGTPLVDDQSFVNTPIHDQLMVMQKGDPDIKFYVLVQDKLPAEPTADDILNRAAVTYTIVVQYPDPDAPVIEPDDTGTAGPAEPVMEEPADSPEKAVEEPALTIERALATSGWYVLCTAGVDPGRYEDIAAYIETQEKMFCYTELGYFGAGFDPETGEPVDESSVGNVYYRTCGIYGRERTSQLDEDIPEGNLYLNVAFVAKWLSYDAGSETSAFKTLASVYPSEMTTTEMKKLAEANLNYFITVGNKNISMNGKVMAGEWADIIRFRDWQKNDMQVAVVNLFVTRPKVPYTDSGISLVQNQMNASLKRGQVRGGIAEEEFDEDGNTIPGFVTSVPLSASLTPAEKASRKLNNCKFKARLAGAIHFAEIKGSLTYEL